MNDLEKELQQALVLAHARIERLENIIIKMAEIVRVDNAQASTIEIGNEHGINGILFETMTTLPERLERQLGLLGLEGWKDDDAG